MINTAPPTSNSVHGREKRFKYNKLRATIFSGCVAQWSRMYVGSESSGERVRIPEKPYILSNIAHFFSFCFFFIIFSFGLFPFILTADS